LMSIDLFYQLIEPTILVLGLVSLAVALILMWLKRKSR